MSLDISRNNIQILGGMYTECYDYFGFIDCTDYSIVIFDNKHRFSLCLSSDYSEISYNLLKTFIRGSSFEYDEFCKNMIICIFLQCGWSDFETIKKLQAKLKLLGLTKVVDALPYIRKEVDNLVKDLCMPLDEYVYLCLREVCHSALNLKM